MARSLRARVSWLPAALLLVVACGGGDASTTEAGISRATPVATERAAGEGESATPSPVASTPPATEDPALAPWAGAICESTAGFDDAVAAAQDGIDPTTLTVPDRVARAQTRYGAYLDALGQQADTLAAIAPPAAAVPYHSALRIQVSELRRLFTEQVAALDLVVLASDIDSATATLQVEVGKLENSLALVRSMLSEGVVDALAAPTRCGEILG